MKKYKVSLTAEEREALHKMVKTGKSAAYTISRARILLKADEGWKYGPVKDADKKEHPCFLPYHNLPLEQRMKDYLFGAIVAAFYAAEAKTKVVR